MRAVPSPPSSSPITDWNRTEPCTRAPVSITAFTPASPATSGPFMSSTPRPCARPPFTTISKGGVSHRPGSPGGTTST